jgi:hypothetical protein
MQDSRPLKIMFLIDRHMAFREIVRSRVLPEFLKRPDVQIALVTHEKCPIRPDDIPDDDRITVYTTTFRNRHTFIGRLTYRLDKCLQVISRDLAVVIFPHLSLAQIRFTGLRNKGTSVFWRLAWARLLKLTGLRPRHLAAFSELWGYYPDLSEIIEKESPDVAVYSNMMIGQMDCLRAARRRNVPIILDVPTWDQATTKGPMTINPDYVIAWFGDMEDELVKYHDVPRERIHIPGILYFDPYFDRPPIPTREEYCARLGLDPKKKIVNYSLSRAGSAPCAMSFIDKIHETIKDGRLGHECQLIVRANPLDNAEMVAALAKRSFVTLEPPAGEVDETGGNWMPAKDEAAARIATLQHADVVIMIQSTMVLDGAAMDCPIVNLAYDNNLEVSELESVTRIFNFDHAQFYQKLDATWKVHSDEELEEALKSYLDDPSIRRENRKKLIDATAIHQDGKTYERWTKFILEVAEQSRDKKSI